MKNLIRKVKRKIETARITRAVHRKMASCEWANWLVIDGDGAVYIYRDKPTWRDGCNAWHHERSLERIDGKLTRIPFKCIYMSSFKGGPEAIMKLHPENRTNC